MTVKDALDFGRRQLKAADISSGQLDSELLLVFATKKSREKLLAHPEFKLPSKQAVRFQDLIGRRAQRTPLVHLINAREFYGLELYINEDVLTPRVETEKMVELALKHSLPGVRLLDVGTGSGAVAIAIKKHRPDLEVWASEISTMALKVAKKNANTHQADIKFVQSDLLSALDESFDVITANLPYLKPDAELMPEVQKEPREALIGGGPDGLELYRQFFEQLPDKLLTGGYVFIESDPWQQPGLLQETAKIGLQPIEQEYFILGLHRKV